MHIQSPREPLGNLHTTEADIRRATDALRAGRGPVAIDTERAAAFRFDDRAFLIQLRRAGVGTLLIDPTHSPRAVAELADELNQLEWIVHAAHTDLPCLLSLGMRPRVLHDTQIAGRLIGLRQLGLAPMLEECLGVTIAKDKGREDWSRRPLPVGMLRYAALDVEFLLELHDVCRERLRQFGRLEWYAQDCEHTLRNAQPLSEPEFSQLRGVAALRSPRSLAVAQHIFHARTDWCRQHDRSPEVCLPARQIVSLATSPHHAIRQARSLSIHASLRSRVIEAIRSALAEPDANLPVPFPRPAKPHPDHKLWELDYPLAHHAARIISAELATAAGDLDLRSDTIAVMRQVRAAAWTVSQLESTWHPGSCADASEADPIAEVEEAFGSAMQRAGARRWQEQLLGRYCLAPLIESLAIY